MSPEEFAKLELGDKIQFRSVTRFTSAKATRKITGFPKVYNDIDNWGGRSPEYVHVRYEGTPVFYVRRDEIIRRVI
jgi:hypothetical protein